MTYGESVAPPSPIATGDLDTARLLDQLADGVIVADRDGRIVLMNRAAGRLAAADPEGLLGRPVADLIPERFRARHREGYRRLVEEGIGKLVGGPALRVSLLRADGSELDVDLALETLGEPADSGFAVVASLRDVADRVALERQVDLTRYVRASVEVAARLQAAAGVEEAYGHVLPTLCANLDWDIAGLWLVDDTTERLSCADVWGVGGRSIEAFEAACRAWSMGLGEGLPGTCWQRGATVATLIDDGPPVLRRADVLRASGMRQGLAFPLVARTEVLGVVELFAADDAAIEPQLLELLTGIGRQLGQFLQRVRAEERLREVQRSQSFLLQASDVLARASGYAETLERLAGVAVPTLGDLCLIDVVDDNRRLVRMAARHADPARQPLVEELRRRYPPQPDGQHPSVDAMATGRSRWSAEMSDEFLHATTLDERHFELVKALGFTSYMTVPLVADGQALGSVTLVSAGSERRFGPADLALAEDLAGRVALVVAKARRYDQAHRASHTLQSSLLPSGLPAVPDLDIAFRYVPGTRDAEVGGDFYDLLRLPSGEVALAVGDVGGHDLVAAATMGQLRSASRALIGRASGPADLIARIQESWDLLGVDRIATALFAFLDPRTGALRVASAGHPPPLVVHSGWAELLPLDPAAPFGAPPLPAVEWSGTLSPGAVLVSYTDGLVEDRTQDIELGTRRLVTAAVSAGTSDPELVCDAILAALAGEDRSDDVALLAVARR